MVRMQVKPAVLRWAIERAGWDEPTGIGRFPSLMSWLSGERAPTLQQLHAFARATHVPFGYLFLAAPPVESTPIPDMRTRGNERRDQLSPDLRDVIYTCQRRQAWFRDFAIDHGFTTVPVVGSETIEADPDEAASRLRRLLDFTAKRRAAYPSSDAALRGLIDLMENVGVLVAVSGVVGSDNHRQLDPDEFGGFALADEYAPLIFVNGADTKAAQIFTIVHELAHISLGESAISDAGVARTGDNRHELWCNRVAAEFLVPRVALQKAFTGDVGAEALDRLARAFRASTLVVLKRLYEANLLKWDEFRERYDQELVRVRDFVAQRRSSDGGGNWYYTHPLRVSRRFIRAVIADTRQGRTTYGDAYRLVGTAKPETFNRLAEHLEVA